MDIPRGCSSSTVSTSTEPSAARSTSSHLLALRHLAERVAKRGSAVPDAPAVQRTADPLGAVQVPQCHVVDAVEHTHRHAVDAPDPDVALAVAALRLRTGHRVARGLPVDSSRHDERVRHDDGARRDVLRASGMVGTDAGQRRRHGRLVRTRERGVTRPRQRVPGDVRVEKGHRVDAHGTVVVVQGHRRSYGVDVGHHVDAAPVQVGAHPQPWRRVVVAGDDDDRHLLAQRAEGAVPEPDRGDRRHRPVEDVAADQHDVDGSTGRPSHDLVEHLLLGDVQVDAVQATPQMPVGGVQQPHRGTVPSAADNPREARAGGNRRVRGRTVTAVSGRSQPGRGPRRRRVQRSGGTTRRRCRAGPSRRPSSSGGRGAGR